MKRIRASEEMKEEDQLSNLFDVDLEELVRVIGESIDNKEDIQECSNALVLGVDVLGKQLDQVETQLQFLVESIRLDTGLANKLSKFFDELDSLEERNRPKCLEKLVKCIQIQKPYRPLFEHGLAKQPGYISEFSLNEAIRRLIKEINGEKNPRIIDPELMITEKRDWGEMKRKNSMEIECQQLLGELKEFGGQVTFPQGLANSWEELWEKLLLLMFLLNKGKVVIETDTRTRTKTLRLTDAIPSS